MTEKTFNKGDVIFKENELGNTFYKITEGSVAITALTGSGEEEELTILGKGAYFGEMAVVEAYPRSAAAAANEDGTAVEEYTVQDLSDSFENKPEEIINIIRALGTRLAGLTEDYAEAQKIIRSYELADQKERKVLFPKLKKYADKKKAEIRTERYSHRHNSDREYAKNVKEYPAGTVICKEGEIGDQMYDIRWGSIGIYKGYGTPDEIRLTVLEEGTFFGELGLTGETARTATAVVVSDTAGLESISLDDLRELGENNPPKVYMILEHISGRLRALTDQYLDICGLAAELAGVEDEEIPDDLKARVEGMKNNIYG